jgi:hypothetical protein
MVRPRTGGESVPSKMQAIYEQVTDLTDEVCAQHLTEEYAALARRMAAALSRKRPSPLAQGQPASWAGGILYALGRVNFLFDPNQTPHLNSRELCECVGVSQSNASGKAKQILDRLGVTLLDPRWCLPGKLDHNPMAWMIQVNGLVVDARMMPRPTQEEAFRKGLIPHLPDE